MRLNFKKATISTKGDSFPAFSDSDLLELESLVESARSGMVFLAIKE